MKTYTILILPLFFSFYVSAADHVFIGKIYSGVISVPNCSNIQVENLGDLVKTKLIISYGECSGKHMVWLSKVTSGGYNQGLREVVDQQIIRSLIKGETYHANDPYCYFNSNREKRIVLPAIFKTWKKKGPMTKKNGAIVEAWMINPKTLKIEKPDASTFDNISCEDESGGED